VAVLCGCSGGTRACRQRSGPQFPSHQVCVRGDVCVCVSGVRERVRERVSERLLECQAADCAALLNLQISSSCYYFVVEIFN
jgi:hypothetical protein